jgi:hypothetical protein
MSPNVTLGSISSGTMRPDDLIPVFADELSRLNTAGEYAALIAEAEAIEDYGAETAEFVLEDLFDVLDGFAPDYCYFGAHPGDGADYGFWLHENWQRMAREDGVLEVSDTSEVPTDYNGAVLHVNDHGNATLYSCAKGELSEVWSVV